MSYITHSLGRNETLRYRAHFHWFYYFAAWGTFFISLVAAMEAYGRGLPWAAGLTPLVGVAAFLSIMIPIWTTEIGVTNQRFIFKRGLLRRTTNELQLRAVEQVNLKQGIPGRLFNFGRLEVHGTGVDDIVLPAIADPIALQRAIQDCVDTTPPPTPASAPQAHQSQAL
jgi:uncharacterized membrane protein YdbT with pleckstrin-like domain